MIKAIKSTYAQSTIVRVLARASDIGKIHEAKSQLALPEADYRAMVSTASRGATSTSADLDARQRARLLRALRAKGYAEPATPSEATIERRAQRLKDLGAIHMGQRALALDDAAYRSLVESASKGKSRSSAHLNAAERSKVLSAMKAKGFEFEEA